MMNDQAHLYAVLYDRDLVDTEALHRFITKSDLVENWWHHIKTIYLIKSKHTADEIAEVMPHGIREAGFLVVEIDVSNCSGWLPDRAWRWIGKRQHELQE
jgi:hypothetical protein